MPSDEMLWTLSYRLERDHLTARMILAREGEDNTEVLRALEELTPAYTLAKRLGVNHNDDLPTTWSELAAWMAWARDACERRGL